jgi:hypothetical protein
MSVRPVTLTSLGREARCDSSVVFYRPCLTRSCSALARQGGGLLGEPGRDGLGVQAVIGLGGFVLDGRALHCLRYSPARPVLAVLGCDRGLRKHAAIDRTHAVFDGHGPATPCRLAPGGDGPSPSAVASSRWTSARHSDRTSTSPFSSPRRHTPLVNPSSLLPVTLVPASPYLAHQRVGPALMRLRAATGKAPPLAVAAD